MMIVAKNRVVSLISVCLLLSGCGRSPSSRAANVPYPDSKEYLAAFGVVPGQPSDIEVASTHFRIPPQYPIALNSEGSFNGTIIRGHADMILFSLDFAKAIDGSGNVTPASDPRRTLTSTQVRVEVSRGNENPVTNEKPPHPDELPWTEKEERWGLVHYVGLFDYYKSIQLRTPEGGPVSIFCRPPVLGGADALCTGDFEYPKGVGITYHIYASELPHWQLIFTTVHNTVESWLITKE